MSYTLSHIAKIIDAEAPLAEAIIEHLLIDSRKPGHVQHSLFFALSGPRRDGHLFIADLYKAGLRYFVISKDVDAENFPGAAFLKVADTLKALQTLAAYHRAQYNIPVIGVTGSNGKTMVKEWLYQLLHQHKNIVRSPKSYNSQIGVPLSVWQITADNTLAIFEAGISKPGEMQTLQTIINPTIGILTNIGNAHSEGFINDEQKLQEKLKLFSKAHVIIANGDDALITANLEQMQIPAFLWGRQMHHQLRIKNIDKQSRQTTIHFIYRDEPFAITIFYTDDASIENAITCCACLLYFKTDITIIQERVTKLQPVSMRLEFKKGINNCTIINDSYSADVNALAIALDFLQQQAKHQKKTVILSDFLDVAGDNENLYTNIFQQLVKRGVQRLIGIGKNMQHYIPVLSRQQSNIIETHVCLTTAEFIQHIHTIHFKDEVVLVKGARAFQFERIVSLLEQKVHQTILEINLDAIAHNVKVFQQLLQPQTKVMVMVKAFGYGSGSAEVAGVLQYHKADYLGVAYADEGVELRKAGITIPIMVLNPEENAFNTIIEHNLEPDIFSLQQLLQFQKIVEDAGLKNYPVHIEIETGMNRLGFNSDDIPALAIALKNNEFISVQSVFSHLAASEDVAEDAFTFNQYQLLNEAAQMLRRQAGISFITHIANSSAILRHPQLQLDMVRLGIGLYGLANNKELIPALTLKSTIAQLKKIKKGESVSYNRRGIALQDSVIATVRIGYADGYSRRLGNGVGKMLVHGREAPVIGTVCMDMTMLDVTHIAHVKEGDDVIVLGGPIDIVQTAQSIGTIPYEIMTGISQRVKRVYYGEG